MVNRGKVVKRLVFVGAAMCAVVYAGVFPDVGQARPARATAPTLGTAANFAVLAGQKVTNTGPSIVDGNPIGNLGVSPGTAVTGFPAR